MERHISLVSGTNKDGRRKGKSALPRGWPYATVTKPRKKRRMVAVKTQVVMGTKRDLAKALASSPCSNVINTSFIEQNNGTTRHFC
jgi:hypothetical protein